MSDKKPAITTIDDFLLLFNLPITKESDRLVSAVLSYMNYMPQGSSIQTSSMNFTKLSDDLLHIQSSVDKEEIVDFLDGMGVIKLPV